MKQLEEKIILTDELLESFLVYLLEEERSTSTIDKYRRDVRKFYDFIGENKEASREKVLEYKQKLLDEYEITSVNSMLAALNQFWQFTGNSKLRVKRIKVQQNVFRDEEKELSEQEYKLLVQKAYDEGKTRLGITIETICATGIRISELKFFTVKAVKNGSVQIHNKGKIRTILIPDKLKKKLLYYINRQGIKNGCVFVTSNGRPVDRSNIWREMKKIGMDTKILGKKIFPHNLRHLFARIYYQLYNDLLGLADILGHTSIETTRIYTATTGKEYKMRLNKLHLVS